MLQSIGGAWSGTALTITRLMSSSCLVP
jgi:hypothetical protein